MTLLVFGAGLGLTGQMVDWMSCVGGSRMTFNLELGLDLAGVEIAWVS